MKFTFVIFCLSISFGAFSNSLKYIPVAPFSAKKQLITNVKSFGAKGDGVTDDYKALLAAADFINKNGSGNLFFPKGNYYIAPYHKKGNSVQNIVFKNCNNLKITGDHAVITVNGSFNRSVDYMQGIYAVSESCSVTPLSFQKCNNVLVQGFELNGNVGDMTKDNGVVENDGVLLKFLNCSNVVLKDLYVHHSQTDGVYIGEGSSNFSAQNIISSNNARQGMSIISLSGAKFENCKFINTGLTGKYGSHSPRAGVDIEPHGTNANQVKDISFNKCLFENNMGSQFICQSPVTTTNITISNSTINASKSDFRYQVRIIANKVNLLNNIIDCGVGSIYPVWKGEPGTDVTISGCTIKSAYSGIESISDADDDNVKISNNTIIYTGNSRVGSYFPYLTTKNIIFNNNKVIIPAALNKKNENSSLTPKGKLSVGNVFQSKQ